MDRYTAGEIRASLPTRKAEADRSPQSSGSFTAPAQSSAVGPSGSASGASVFDQNCASCHTLAAAHATGTVGPSLDQIRPSETKVSQQVTNGGGGMPAFGGRLTTQQIDAVAKFVATTAGK